MILAGVLNGIEVRGSVHELAEFCDIVTGLQPIDHIATVWQPVEGQ